MIFEEHVKTWQYYVNLLKGSIMSTAYVDENRESNRTIQDIKRDPNEKNIQEGPSPDVDRALIDDPHPYRDLSTASRLSYQQRHHTNAGSKHWEYRHA